jgi:hypothetical protein
VRGKWYLAAVCNFDDPKLLTPDGVLGVDFGIINIATDNLGNQYSGAKLKPTKNASATLQRVGTRAAKHCLLYIQTHRFHCGNVAGNIASRAIVTQPIFAA